MSVNRTYKVFMKRSVQCLTSTLRFLPQEMIVKNHENPHLSDPLVTKGFIFCQPHLCFFKLSDVNMAWEKKCALNYSRYST